MPFTNLSSPAELKFRRLYESIMFEALRDVLRGRYTSAVLFRAMLFWSRWKGKKDGLAHFCFIDLFGVSEQRSDKGDPVQLDDPDFHEWMRLRELRSKRQWQRDRAKRKREKKSNGTAEVGGADSGELRSS